MKPLLSKLESFPELLTSQHLVELGLFSSLDATYQARMHGNSPDYLKIKRKILYPKDGIRSFIEQRIQQGSMPYQSSTT